MVGLSLCRLQSEKRWGGKMKIRNLGLVALMCVFGAGIAVAQETDSKPKSKADIRTVTGCLSQGDSADEFKLTAKDGSTWELRSSAVKLSEHVGHSVAAHGVVSNAKMHNMKEDAKSAATDTGIKKNDTEHGHLKVTSVRMVSESCKE
jgi:hypothetical protein